MPLKQKFAVDQSKTNPQEYQRRLYQEFGLVDNPFPKAAQTTGHPRMPLPQDDELDNLVMDFYRDRRSQAIAITATQGVGKTNLLNAYAQDLREVLSPQGFFVIRYMADPDASFDPLVRSLFEVFEEHHLLQQAIAALAEKVADGEDLEEWLDGVRMPEMKALIRSLLVTQEEQSTSVSPLADRFQLAYQWLLGFPVRKRHQMELGVHFRLDTVESKTRALRDMVYFGASMNTLEGIFLLMDELEKQGALLSQKSVVQYMSALRALIDALPKYLFLMVALTPDALQRYREMLPALKGRLTSVLELPPIQNEEQAIALMNFYWQVGRDRAMSVATPGWDEAGKRKLINESEVRQLFQTLLQQSTIEGVRQREFLDQLSMKADQVMNAVVSA